MNKINEDTTSVNVGTGSSSKPPKLVKKSPSISVKVVKPARQARKKGK